MTVALLAQHLSDLATLLRSAQAAKAAGELEQIGVGLAPFREMPLATFSDFLVRADEFARTGKVSASATKSRSPSTRAPAKAKADVGALSAETKAVYERAGQGLVTDLELDAIIAALSALTIPSLAQVAAGIEVPIAKSAKKQKILDEIRAAIKERQAGALRARLIHPPTAEILEATDEEQLGSRSDNGN